MLTAKCIKSIAKLVHFNYCISGGNAIKLKVGYAKGDTMKYIKKISAAVFSAVMSFALAAVTFATSQEALIKSGFTEEDRLLFGIFPIWAFIAMLAGLCMLVVIVLVIIGRSRSAKRRKERKKQPQKKD